VKTLTAPVEAPEVAEPIEVVRPMRLSEALRWGAMNTRQAHGSYAKSLPKGGMSYCALGTLYYALGYQSHDALHAPEWAFLNEKLAEPLRIEGCDHNHDHGGNNLASIIIHLNDFHKWPRERIADALSANGL
jgi:hypothetical protein